MKKMMIKYDINSRTDSEIIKVIIVKYFGTFLKFRFFLASSFKYKSLKAS